jgi:putative transposase
MPSIKTITPILGGNYYHIFNRGTNRQNIFFQPKNYDYFLKLLKDFLGDYVYFLAYSLMPNHFHLVIKVKDEIATETDKDQGDEGTVRSEENGSIIIKDEVEIGKIVVNQLKRMFITYAMAINNQENRVGNLFDPKYKRLLIENQDYLEYAIFYTHFNPEKHGIVDDFRKYKYCSYSAVAGIGKTSMAREFVFELYGGKEAFLNYHNVLHEERTDIILE